MYTQFFELNEYKPDKLFKDCVEFPIILAISVRDEPYYGLIFLLYDKSRDFMSIVGLCIKPKHI